MSYGCHCLAGAAMAQWIVLLSHNLRVVQSIIVYISHPVEPALAMSCIGKYLGRHLLEREITYDKKKKSYNSLLNLKSLPAGIIFEYVLCIVLPSFLKNE